MTSRVPPHEHKWFPIADYANGEHALYACAVTMRCVKTITAKEYARLKSPLKGTKPYE